MWGWLKPLLEALLAFFDKKASAPSTIQDENTPKPIFDRWSNYIKQRLRDKGGGGGQPS
jgi:hypothetical protein